MGAALADDLAAAGSDGVAAIVYNVPLLARKEHNGVVFVAHVSFPMG
jgi:hypothetical protein